MHCESVTKVHTGYSTSQLNMSAKKVKKVIKVVKQESSAKLTNQRVSYAFTSSPFSLHACHVLPASKFQYSYFCVLLIFYRHQ